jgi:tetratricopeptide (TPR) repeat protein
MTTPQITYNPGILGDAELARSFVVRQTLLELILETLRENVASPAGNRHLILIGPRGIGKTMLVRRAAAAVRSNPEYSSKWYPLVFGEESYSVSTPGEFWLDAIFHLADDTGDPQFEKALEELREERDETRLRDRALGQLLDYSDREGKRILLIVENLNTLIGEQMSSDAAWDLRHTLLNERRLMLLGTATNRFDEIKNVGHAWFEMFSLHQIQPLTLDECGELWRSVTGIQLQRNPLKAVRILTGGNPRLVKILASFAVDHSFRQLMEQLVHLIDDHTEYFKGHLDNLAAGERKIFVAVLERWDPVGAAEVARQTRLTVNEVSATLGRLCSRGAIEVVSQKTRRKLYQASERLYNIYYLMRRRGHPEGRVHAAVQFMVTFYERQELVTRLGDLAREACGLPVEVRKDHYCAYREVLRKMEPIIPQVVECTPLEFFQSDDARSARELGASGLIRQAHSLYHQDKFSDSEKLYRHALMLDENNAEVWSGLAAVLMQDSRHIREAEQALRKGIALSPNDILWHNLGLILAQQERWDEAEQAFSTATALDPKFAPSWDRLGQVRAELERLQESEQACRIAVQLSPDESAYWNNLARPLWGLGRLNEAEQALRTAIDLNPNSYTPWQGLGHLLLETGLQDEAERVWAEALKLHPEELAPCSIHLLDLQFARGVEPARLLSDAESWLSLSKRTAKTLAVMAKFVAGLGLADALPVAEAWAREAFAKIQNSDSAEALSLILAEMNRWPEAIEYSNLLLTASGNDENARELSTKFLIRAAAVGFAKEALKALLASKGAAALEPLVVGLQIFLGESPVVAKEIFEIGLDVAARIRKEPAFGPVTLVWQTGLNQVRLEMGERAPHQEFKEFPTNEAAIRYACDRMDRKDGVLEPFIAPFIMAGNECSWSKTDLQSEYERRKKVAVARSHVS